MEQAYTQVNNSGDSQIDDSQTGSQIAPINDGQVLSIDRSTRWQVRQRLQELDILCDCSANGKLWVVVDTPVALVQVRSVLQQWSMSRQVLVEQLEKCWQYSG
jgi:hypothetical protein